MKTNFRKTLAVLLAALMLTSVFSVAAFAATTYTVTYYPGTGVDGETYVDTYTTSIKIRGVTYTREHYTHTGWSTTEGGTVTNTFNSTWRRKQNLVLYPVWKGDSYTLTYAPGAFSNETAERTVATEYGKPQGLLDAVFTRDEYVQMGWSLTDGGEKIYDLGAMTAPIEGNLTLYPYWVQMCNITYSPGANGTGEEVVETVKKGESYTAKGAIFTREGYTQTGWSLTDGGYMTYSLFQNHIEATSDVTLYPYWVKNEYKLDVSADELYFGDFCEDYAAPDAKSFTITNNGNVPVNVLFGGVTNYTVSVDSSVSLDAGESVTVTVQPLAGMPVGEYSETLLFVSEQDDKNIKAVNLEFSVSEHVFGNYVSDGNATYSADGTKSAPCVKGCGARDVLPDVGSMKVYSADNNDAVGLSKSYTHHRTVRFTAYGSGMDDTEGVVGKRFLPVSWFVNDDFNGEFADGNYDVTFTHTIYGDYTLTINYVEQEYNAEKDEWVDTGVTDTKVFEYTVGPTDYEKQEIIRPNTILKIIFGLFAQILSMLGLGG